MNSISILGCGWLGLPLGKHLVKAGFEVKGSTTQISKLSLMQEACIQPYQLSFEPELIGDARDFFDADILMVNIPPRNRNGIDSFHEQQLKNIRQLAQGKVRHILFISSTAVYPSYNQEVSEKDADAKSLSRSGTSLLEMENLFTQHPEFETTVLRFGGLYGPGRHPGRFLAGRQDLPGANNPVNMIHLDDCIGVIAVIIDKDIWGETFNVCSPTEETRQSFYTKAARDLGLELPTFTDESAPFKKVNVDKLMKVSDYLFKH